VDWPLAILVLLGPVLLLMALGMPVAFAFLAANILGAFLFLGGVNGVYQLVANASVSVTSFLLVPIPLFVLMGELFFHSGLARRIFDSLDKLVGGLPGRLAYITVGGGTLFGALSGASMANTALLGSLLVPEMTKRGYKPVLSMGPIMGSGGLAILIPPSGLAVLLGSLAHIDIGRLLIAGILPGLVLASLYLAVIRLVVAVDPQAAPPYAVTPTPLREKLASVAVNILPMSLVVFCVVGLILLGLATPTEAAAFGVGSVIVLILAYGLFTFDALWRSLMGALRVTVMALLIIVGSSTFSQLLAFSGASNGIVGWATAFDVGPTTMVVLMFLVLMLLGMIMDQVSMLLITLPIFMPLAASLAIDPVWLGVVMMMGLEIGLITPPFGLLLFIMLGVAPKGTTIGQVIVAGLPYVACALATAALVIAEPALAVWLPSLIAR